MRIAIIFACSACTASGSMPSDGSHTDALTAPLVVTEPCNKQAPQYTYAEHAFPGKTVADLSPVIVRLHVVPNNGYTLPGYTYVVAIGTEIRDGYVAVYCNATGTANEFDSADFILPQ